MTTKTEVLNESQRKFMNNFYTSALIEEDDINRKIQILRGRLEVTGFHVYGGGETSQMELNSLECMFLHECGQLSFEDAN
jgi:hypothetical protein